MSAPNSPVATLVPSSRSSAATNASNIGRATFGGAASDHDGRLPLRVDANSVNCDTTRIAPPVSSSERFIAPVSSANTRSCTIFRASQSRSSAVSSGAAPASTRSPGPISPVTRAPAVTLACETLCSTTRIAAGSSKASRRR
jgi:hypothetical protein